jgi:hypothetical protein
LNKKKKNLCVIGILVCISIFRINPVMGQSNNKFDFDRIEDNSFLIEEAYNQDPGVIQHISGFQYMKDHTWMYTFTDEWPVPGRTHQLSTTIPILKSGETGLGDIALNYRYQAVLRTQFAFSPRFSLILPTGNYKNGLGAGVIGYQLSLPFSYLVSLKIVTHYNIGITITPGFKDALGSKSDQITYNYGFSVILLLNKNLNFMLEIVGNTTSVKAANIPIIRSNTLLVSPGIRYAINFKSGLQIVPGLALPIGLVTSNNKSGLFAYLSFEHPLWKPKK